MAENVDVRYLNRDFASIQDQLINFAEAYYPNTVQDFSEGSVGLMYIDMASYVGDVLSFYTDVQFKESFIQFAEEEQNVFSLAKELGYRPNVTNPATTKLNVFAVVPSIEDDEGNIKPDLRFVPIIEKNMVVRSSSNSGVEFRTVEEVNFKSDTPDSPVEVNIFETVNGQPSKYLLTKEVQAVAGTIESTTFSFDQPEPYPTRIIQDENVIEILNVTDSQGNEWKEVPYLAQDKIFEEYRNTSQTDKKLSEFKEQVPYLLSLETQTKRFITRVQTDQRTFLQFGSGTSGNENVNPLDIGDPKIPDLKQTSLSLDPSNSISSNSYGEIPFNTTLEVEYVSGGGINSNVPIDDLTEIVNVNFNLENTDVAATEENRQTLQDIQDSIRTSNPVPATGGGPGETIEEIRKNAQAFFATQNRAVTKKDYVTRVLSMPSKYGSVAKAMVRKETQTPLIDLYVLGWNSKNHLVPVNEAIKKNIRTFLKKYRMLTDSIDVSDGSVINVGAKVETTIKRNSSKKEAKLSIIDQLKEMFSPKNRSFDQPIVKGRIISDLNSLDLIQNVRSVSFENKIDPDEGYAGNKYDLDYAERRRVIYPSKDPSVFTVRYPDKDIEVKIV